MVGGKHSDSSFLKSVEMFPPNDACSIPPLLQERHGHRLSLMPGGRLVACGGHGSVGGLLHTPTISCVSWVAGNKSWTPGANAPLARALGAQSSTLGGRMVSGGFGGDSVGGFSEVLKWTPIPAAENWTQLWPDLDLSTVLTAPAPLPRGLRGAQASIVRGRIRVTGGYDGDSYRTEVII